MTMQKRIRTPARSNRRSAAARSNLANVGSFLQMCALNAGRFRNAQHSGRNSTWTNKIANHRAGPLLAQLFPPR